MPYGSQTQEKRTLQLRLATSDSLSTANSIVYSMLCSQQTIRLMKDPIYQRIMNLFNHASEIISAEEPSAPILSILMGSAWYLVD